MQGEYRRREPGSGDRQTAQHEPQHHRRDRVKDDVGDVVARRIELPDTVFDPEGGEHHGVVLNRCSEVGPDPLQTVRAVQERILGDVARIVPDVGTAHGRQIRQQYGKHDHGGRQQDSGQIGRELPGGYRLGGRLVAGRGSLFCPRAHVDPCRLVMGKLGRVTPRCGAPRKKSATRKPKWLYSRRSCSCARLRRW